MPPTAHPRPPAGTERIGPLALAGRTVRLEGGPGGLLLLRAPGRTLAANLGETPARVAGRDLAPMDFAILGDRT